MALTEEQEKIILTFVEKQTAAQITAEKDAADKAAVEKVKAEQEQKGKSLASEAKEEHDNEKASKEHLSQIESSIKFNTGIKDFVEKNKSLLPDEANKILSTASRKVYKDANEEAGKVRMALLDSYLSQKENIDTLTFPMGERAKEYNALTESEKEKRSGQYWDLVETGIVLKQGFKKAEALNKINGGNTRESSGNIIEDKMLAAANRKFNINNENK
jgi:hypothetical protein